MATVWAASTGFESSAAWPIKRLALANRTDPKSFMASGNRGDGNRHGTPATAIAGHTTGGTRKISEEVTAIPLEQRNRCHRGEGSCVGGPFVGRTREPRQEGDDDGRERVKFSLRSRGEGSRGNGSGRCVALRAAGRGGAMLVIACDAATTPCGDPGACARGGGRSQDALTGQDKPQQNRDSELDRAQHHYQRWVAVKRQPLRNLPRVRSQGNKSFTSRLLDATLPEQFGVAPSTVAHTAKQSEVSLSAPPSKGWIQPSTKQARNLT